MKIIQRIKDRWWLRFGHRLTEGEELALRMRGQPNTVLYNYGQPFIPDRWRKQMELTQEIPVTKPDYTARLPPQGIPAQAQIKWQRW